MPEGGSFLKESEDLRSLRVLEEIENNPHVSQRELASRLGVALGIANSLVHTLIRKGMIKIKGENNRSLTYHLTKKGVLLKAKLAVEWTGNTLKFYSEARRQVELGLGALVEAGVHSVVLVGGAELAEITAITASRAGLKVLGIAVEEAGYMGEELLGIPVGGLSLLGELKPDAAIVCVQTGLDDVLVTAARVSSAAPGVAVYDVTGALLGPAAG